MRGRPLAYSSAQGSPIKGRAFFLGPFFTRPTSAIPVAATAAMSGSSVTPSPGLELLPTIGLTIMVNVGLSLTQTLLYGFLCAVVIYGTNIQLRREKFTRGSRMLLIVTLFLFLSCTAELVTQIIATMRITKNYLMNNQELSLAQKLKTPDEIKNRLVIAENFFTAINFLVSDAVVVWRAWALWPGNRKMLIIPCLLLFGTFVSSFLFASLMPFFQKNKALQRHVNNAQTANWVFSFCTNALATGLIGYKIWEHRRFIRTYAGPRAGVSKAEKVLYLLLESGTIYCVLQLVFLAVHVKDSQGAGQSWTIAADFFLVICVQLSGILPTAVIIGVWQGFSIADTPGISANSYLGGSESVSRTARDDYSADLNMKFAVAPRSGTTFTTDFEEEIIPESAGTKVGESVDEKMRETIVGMRIEE